MEEHLFRRESGRLVAALTRLFGVHNLALAEDVVQDAFCRALEVWKVRGVPDNPSAWLMTTAQEPRARRHPARAHRAHVCAGTEPPARERVERRAGRRRGLRGAGDSRRAAADDVFVLPPAAERGRAGRVDSEPALRFRRGRDRRGLPDRCRRRSRSGSRAASPCSPGRARLFDLDDAEYAARLAAVRRALYLLFNEGYHGASRHSAVRAELCHEAIRLIDLIAEHPAAAAPETHALAALMCLHAARLPARIDAGGDLLPFAEQDRSRWDAALVAKGLALLERSAAGDALSRRFTSRPRLPPPTQRRQVSADTDWQTVIALYDRLMTIAPSPVVALNRAIAIGEARRRRVRSGRAARDRRSRAPGALSVLSRRDGRARAAARPDGSGADALRGGHSASPATTPSGAFSNSGSAPAPVNRPSTSSASGAGRTAQCRSPRRPLFLPPRHVTTSSIVGGRHERPTANRFFARRPDVRCAGLGLVLPPLNDVFSDPAPVDGPGGSFTVVLMVLFIGAAPAFVGMRLILRALSQRPRRGRREASLDAAPAIAEAPVCGTRFPAARRRSMPR